MAESILIDKTFTKEERYKQLLPQIKALVEGEDDYIANIANICGALKYSMNGFFWVGFYFVKCDELVLGPFQGPAACTRIKIPNGVCGTAVKERKTIIVDDVNKFPGHIACNSDSKSEIVVPIFDGNQEVTAVLDVDSDSFSWFDSIDEKYLTELASLIGELKHSSI